MKVAVSILDAVFSEAEDLAKRLKASRSGIYSRASVNSWADMRQIA